MGGWWRGNLGGWWRGNLIHSRTEDFISAGPLGAGSGRRRRRAAPKPFFGCGLGGASSCCGTSGDRRAAAEPPPTAAHKAALAARARARGHRTFSGWRGRRFCLWYGRGRLCCPCRRFRLRKAARSTTRRLQRRQVSAQRRRKGSAWPGSLGT